MDQSYIELIVAFLAGLIVGGVLVFAILSTAV